MTDPNPSRAIAALVEQQRIAAFSTSHAGAPAASLVAYALDAPATGVLLHLSDLAAHTRNLRHEPRAALLIHEPDGDPRADPQTLARLALGGRVTRIAADDPGYAAARAGYLARLPHAEPRFAFGDFQLYRLTIGEVAYVGGFARAMRLTPDEFASIMRMGAPGAGEAP
jgi:putative heme iron utilization protein